MGPAAGIGWGFIGAGRVARLAMAPAVHASQHGRLRAAAARDRERAAALGPEVALPAYADILDDPEVAVVYVSLANHQHAEWVRRALAAGKHVLCEKPMSLDAAEARGLAQAATAADRLLVEAVWTRWHPRFQRLVALATSGSLGSLREIASAFTFTADGGDFRDDPDMGGGALLDVGGYQAHAWVAMTGGAPGFALDGVERHVTPTGIDGTTYVAGRIGGTRVDAVASFEQPERQTLSVRGSRDTATMLGTQAFTCWREPSALLVGGYEERFDAVDAYALMVDAVSARAAGDAAWIVPLADSVRVAEVLDAIADAP